MVRDLCSKRTAADKIMNKMNENRKLSLIHISTLTDVDKIFLHKFGFICEKIDFRNHVTEQAYN